MAHDLLRTWAHHVEKFRECRVGKTAMDKNLSFAKRDGLPLERKTVNNEDTVSARFDEKPAWRCK